MDNMDDLFDDIQLSQSDFEIAELSELLNSHPDIFDNETDFDDVGVEIADIAEIMDRNPNIFEVNVYYLLYFHLINKTNKTNTLISYLYLNMFIGILLFKFINKFLYCICRKKLNWKVTRVQQTQMFR